MSVPNEKEISNLEESKSHEVTAAGYSSPPSDTEAKAGNYTGSDEMILGGAAEAKLVRKLDLHIIPVVMTLYLLSFLDRYVLPLSKSR